MPYMPWWSPSCSTAFINFDFAFSCLRTLLYIFKDQRQNHIQLLHALLKPAVPGMSPASETLASYVIHVAQVSSSSLYSLLRNVPVGIVAKSDLLCSAAMGA